MATDPTVEIASYLDGIIEGTVEPGNLGIELIIAILLRNPDYYIEESNFPGAMKSILTYLSYDSWATETLDREIEPYSDEPSPVVVFFLLEGYKIYLENLKDQYESIHEGPATKEFGNREIENELDRILKTFPNWGDLSREIRIRFPWTDKLNIRKIRMASKDFAKKYYRSDIPKDHDHPPIWGWCIPVAPAAGEETDIEETDIEPPWVPPEGHPKWWDPAAEQPVYSLGDIPGYYNRNVLITSGDGTNYNVGGSREVAWAAAAGGEWTGKVPQDSVTVTAYRGDGHPSNGVMKVPCKIHKGGPRDAQILVGEKKTTTFSVPWADLYPEERGEDIYFGEGGAPQHHQYIKQALNDYNKSAGWDTVLSKQREYFLQDIMKERDAPKFILEMIEDIYLNIINEDLGKSIDIVKSCYDNAMYIAVNEYNKNMIKLRDEIIQTLSGHGVTGVIEKYQEEDIIHFGYEDLEMELLRTWSSAPREGQELTDIRRFGINLKRNEISDAGRTGSMISNPLHLDIGPYATAQGPPAQGPPAQAMRDGRTWFRDGHPTKRRLFIAGRGPRKRTKRTKRTRRKRTKRRNNKRTKRKEKKKRTRRRKKKNKTRKRN